MRVVLLVWAFCLAVGLVACHTPKWTQGATGVWHRAESKPPLKSWRNSQYLERNIRDDTSTLRSMLSASPKVINNGDKVEVRWTNIFDWSTEDFIGVYSPPDSPNDEYIDYAYVTEQDFDSATTAAGVNGSFSFRLLNIRDNYVFRYFRAADDHKFAVATSNIVRFANPNEPTQGHIALTGDPTQMRVMWVSNSTEVPTVEYWRSSDEHQRYATGISKTYTAKMMCGGTASISSPQNYIDPGQIHDVLLTGLETETVYQYRYGNPNTGWSKSAVFITPPANGVDTEIRFVVYADMGTSSAPGAYTTVQRVLSGPMRYKQAFVWHVGDISYAWGRGIVWEQFFNLVEPIATKVPYMVGIGNHEYDHVMDGQNDPSHAPGVGWHPSWGNFGDDSNGECGVPMYYRYHMPDNGNSVFWYSYNYALLHVVMMSSEHNYTHGSPQYEWLEADLAAVNRSLTPWVIVGTHRPLYCSENYPSDYQVSLYMREYLEGLFLRHKVDLVLAGHYHSYERTCPVYQGNCMGDYTQPQAPVHIVLGMAGASLDNADYMPMPWSLYHDQQFGYVQIRITNATALRFEYYHNVNNQLADAFWLHKK